MKVMTSEENTTLLLCASYVNLIQELLVLRSKLREHRVIKMRKRFFKKLSQRLKHNCQMYFERNVKIYTNFTAYIPKKRVRKLWMKKRSRHWWQSVVNDSKFDDQMIENFRMDRESFHHICEKLSSELSSHPCSVREALPVDMKVAIAIYKLGSCAEYRVIANQFGVHKSTVQKCVYSFCKAMVKVLLKEEIKIPTGNEALMVNQGFKEKSGIPQIMGAIDGTHIPITPPANGSADYVNRKGWPSVVLQAVVDYKYLFIDITCKHPGSAHDATVLKDSFLYKRMEQEHLPTETIDGMDIRPFFVGDPAYPLLPWLIKGYNGALTPEEESFNGYLSKARIVVENAFGRLKGRWRILQKRIDIDVGFVPSVVATCCILHNILERRKSPYRETWNSHVQLSETLLTQPSPQSELISLQGGEIRNHLKDHMAKNFPLIKRQIF